MTTANEQLISSMADLLKQMVDITTIVNANVPVVVEQIITYKTYLYVTWVSIGLIIMISGLFIIPFLLNKWKESLPETAGSGEWDRGDIPSTRIASRLIGGFFGMIIFIPSAIDLYQITYMREYWLMKYAMDLIQQLT